MKKESLNMFDDLISIYFEEILYFHPANDSNSVGAAVVTSYGI